MAAQSTVSDDRVVHSLHAYFLRPGDVNNRVRLAVEVVRDGRGFSSRQVCASQNGRELFRVMCSFQVPQVTPEYTAGKMPTVPAPEAVSFTYDDFTLQEMGVDDWPGSARPIDILYINPPTQRGESVTEPQLMWMRIRDPLNDDPQRHLAGLAYLSDATLVDHVLLPHGLRWQDEDFEGTSLDHAMWFHRFARADDWLLYEQRVEATGAGRGLAYGRFFDRDGHLIASCAQEGLMRWADSR